MTHPMPPGPPGQPPPGPPVTCYRHHDRPAGVSCQRCNRPICPSCMVQASVGFHCPECVHEGARTAPVYSTTSLPNQRPYVTWVLIAINAAVFVAQLATADRSQGSGELLYGASGEVFQRFVLFGPAVGAGEWWRLVTGGFLHGGLIHIGMNMYVLYAIGPQIERLLGGARYLSLYVAALLAGALGVMLVSPGSPTLGASGAIFGLLGAAAAFQLSHHIDIWKSGLGRLIAINVAITFFLSSYISVGGHIGGLLGGGVVGYLMFQLEERSQSMWVGVGVGVALAVMFGVAGAALAPTTYTLR